MIKALPWWPGKAEMATPGHEDDLVTQSDIGSGVGDEYNRLPPVSQLTQQAHHSAIKSGIQTGGRFVKKEQAWIRHQLHADAHPFSLAPAELTNPREAAMTNLKNVQYPLNSLLLGLLVGQS